jgi:hypothetical protein
MELEIIEIELAVSLSRKSLAALDGYVFAPLWLIVTHK